MSALGEFPYQVRQVDYQAVFELVNKTEAAAVFSRYKPIVIHANSAAGMSVRSLDFIIAVTLLSCAFFKAGSETASVALNTIKPCIPEHALKRREWQSREQIVPTQRQTKAAHWERPAFARICRQSLLMLPKSSQGGVFLPLHPGAPR